VKAFRYLPIIAMLYITCLLISNISAFKIVSVGMLAFPAGLIVFPLSYIFDDILTEVYGYAHSRRIIWTGMLCNFLFFVVGKITVMMPPATFWPYQHEYMIVLSAVPRLILASLVSYFCGEFLNSYLLAKLKVATQGKKYWLRLIVSSGLGQALDSVLFCSIAFIWVVPLHDLIDMIASQYAIKFTYEILVIPITYAITKRLKSVEQVDHYDYHTHFNPFLLKVDEQ